MQINAYLNFKGNCKEAFEFYADVLGAKVEAMIPHTGTPVEAHVPAEWRDKILHARIAGNGWVLMGSDAPPGKGEGAAHGFCINIGVNDPQEADRLFAKLAENGSIQMPIQKTFWATRFGMMTDRFGTPWMINCEEKK